MRRWYLLRELKVNIQSVKVNIPTHHDAPCRTEIEQIMPLFKRCEFKKGKVGSSWREAIAVPSINMHRATQSLRRTYYQSVVPGREAHQTGSNAGTRTYQTYVLFLMKMPGWPNHKHANVFMILLMTCFYAYHSTAAISEQFQYIYFLSQVLSGWGRDVRGRRHLQLIQVFACIFRANVW